MKYIINFLIKIISKKPLIPLGRWNIDYCNKRMNTKIDLSNEDHCGPCGHYAKTQINLQNKNINIYDNKVKNDNKIKKI